MTRPIIVRADTLDLQDQDAPSAKDHSQHQIPMTSNKALLGSHQAAEIRHVKQERYSEENNLREAWNDASQSLNDESTLRHEDEADGFNDKHLQAQHNAMSGEDGHHSEEDDGEHSSDDDMMDRMSSSPSIDEGAYPNTTPGATQWPPRTSSLTPTRGTFNRSATSTPDDSSPFVHLPTHLPLNASIEGGNNQDAQRAPASPDSTTRSQDSSPFVLTPDHLPLFVQKSRANRGNTSPLSSKHHHHHHHLNGEYNGRHQDHDEDDNQDNYDDDNQDNYDADFPEDDDITSDYASEDDHENYQQITTLPRSEIHLFARSAENLSVFSSENYTNMSDYLLPEDDFLLDQTDSHLSRDDNVSMYSLASSTSWATISDVSSDSDQDNTGNLDNHRDDDSDDLSYYDDDRFVDSGWGGECLRETEDIDFDFVYALHTFVATVEGQANATKGDTMVLLDDSNSYWWLVRIVKDHSIGYLPAEHIETPTERLARLNKHRNVDLSQTMLGDSMEKSKNPLKKAMRRRNAKTVQFAAPTYVEASDYDYSSEEEDNPVPASAPVNNAAKAENGNTAESEHAEHRESTSDDDIKSRMSDSSSSDDSRSMATDVRPPVEEPLGSPSLVDKTEAAPLKSRKGTPRNADSFLKDDSAEPRRITLTPNILRDDGSSISSLEKTRSTSFESLEKTMSPPEKTKEEKKKKEKKQGGMLSGLFKSKKKDKKNKDDENAASEAEKVSGETSRLSSGQSSPTLDRNTSFADKKGKLQKSPSTSTASIDTVVSSSREAPVQKQQAQSPRIEQQQQQPEPQPQRALSPPQQEEIHPTHFFAELEGSQVAYEVPTGHEDQMRDIQSRQSTRSPEQPIQSSSSMSAITNAIANKIKHNPDEPRRVKAKKSKTRVELDDFDDLDDDDNEDEKIDGERLSESPVEITHNTFMHGTEVVHIPTNMDLDDYDNSTRGEHTPNEQVSEEEGRSSSPIMLDMPTESDSFEAAEPPVTELKRRSETGSDMTDDDSTPVPSKPQSPNTTTFQHASGLPNLQQSPTPPPARQAPYPPPRQVQQGEEPRTSTPQNAQRSHSSLSTASTAPSPSSPSPSPASITSKETTASWSNASLRAWLDGGEGNDIRDMLVVIHDKSDVVPVPKDHPLMKGLWDEERNACGKMMGELDELLGGWLGRKKNKTGKTEMPSAPNADVGPVGA